MKINPAIAKYFKDDALNKNHFKPEEWGVVAQETFNDFQPYLDKLFSMKSLKALSLMGCRTYASFLGSSFQVTVKLPVHALHHRDWFMPKLISLREATHVKEQLSYCTFEGLLSRLGKVHRFKSHDFHASMS